MLFSVVIVTLWVTLWIPAISVTSGHKGREAFIFEEPFSCEIEVSIFMNYEFELYRREIVTNHTLRHAELEGGWVELSELHDGKHPSSWELVVKRKRFHEPQIPLVVE